MAAAKGKTAKKAVKKTPAKKATKKAMVKKAGVKKAGVKKVPGKKPTPQKAGKVKPKLLSGGNPQIAKGYGDAPVKAYIAAVSGWQREVCRRIDALTVKAVPGVLKAVKWNSPFYGVEEKMWFMSFHIFAKYVKIAFFQGQSLRPIPPGESSQKDVRYLDIREDHKFDETQFTAWIKQACKLPGLRM